jgi:hypothetical protein
MVGMRARGVVMLIAVGLASVACGMEAEGRFAGSLRTSGAWAEPPAEVPLPPAAPDDPAAYRGVRFRVTHDTGPPYVDSGGRPVPWVHPHGGGYTNAGMRAEGPYFGHQHVFDGRRRMIWFIRLVEAPVSPPPPPEPIEPGQVPPEPLQAVLDVLVLPGQPSSSYSMGCSRNGDEVVIDGDAAWRLNRSSGRIEPVDPADAACPEEGD